jgi:predicted sugar kinase
MVIACDRSYAGENGAEEAATIAACATRPNPHRVEMLRRVDHELIPAIGARDWERASVALGQYGMLAGEVFRAVQGGIYRSAQVAQTIDQLQRWGVPGAGQSSWGPTVYVLARDDEHADWITGRLRGHMPSGTSIRVARCAGPATYSVLESSSSPS